MQRAGAAAGSSGEPNEAEVDPIEKLVKGMETDSKKLIRKICDMITTAKEVFAKSEGQKYLAELHTSCAKVLPKLASALKKVENVHLAKVECDAEKLAIAKKVSEVFGLMEEIEEWAAKFFGKGGKRAEKS